MDYRIRMRNLREDHDLTQKAVGEIIHKSQQGYSHIEEGRAELKIDDLNLLCKFCGVSADYFIGHTGKKKKYQSTSRKHLREEVLSRFVSIVRSYTV